MGILKPEGLKALKPEAYLQAHTLLLFLRVSYFSRQQILTIKLGLLKKGVGMSLQVKG